MNTKIKTYVFDTSWLIDNPDAIYDIGGNIAVIPASVVRELDGLKRSSNEDTAKAARKVGRTLERLSSYGDLDKGVKLPTKGILRIAIDYEIIEGLASQADNKIVGAAVTLKKRGEDVTLMTTDGNMRTIARRYGVKAEGNGYNDFPTKSFARDTSQPDFTQTSSGSSSKALLYRLTIAVITVSLFVSIFASWEGHSLEKGGVAIVVTLIAVSFIRKRASKQTGDKRVLNSDDITSVIAGQDEPIEDLLKAISATSRSSSRGKRPRFIGLIAGSAETEKMEFTKTFANSLRMPIHIFNMGNYAGYSGREASAAHEKLFGSNRGYVDGKGQGEFIAAIAKNPSCVIVLGEIEKASKKILDTFLTAFQEGEVRNSRGEAYSVSGAFIFCNSNLCQTTPPDTREADIRKILAEEGLRREFVNEIDKVTLFRQPDSTAGESILESAYFRLADQPSSEN